MADNGDLPVELRGLESASAAVAIATEDSEGNAIINANIIEGESDNDEGSHERQANLAAALKLSPIVPGGPALRVFPLSNYGFGQKDALREKDATPAERMERHKRLYMTEGMRRTVEGVIVVHQHKHLHVLLIQIGPSFFKLPGGRLKPGEDEIEGLKAKLTRKLAPTMESYYPKWQVGELLCSQWRPNFEPVLYPYLPPHITKPKECRRVFIVELPEKCYFGVPKNYKLIAVPLFELYDNAARYGPQIASIPHLLGRFSATFLS